MDLEHHQLELRYERLRVRRPAKERQVLSSLAAHGQRAPIVVVAGGAGDRFVVVDGYKRVRALKRLGRDTAWATAWELDELSALLLARSLRSAEAESALEQGWLLSELQSSFGLGQEELAERFDRSPSWVSRRLALVGELPVAVQEEVRRGRIGAHAAMKHLVPMARATRSGCERLARAIAPLGLSTREVGELYRSWRDSGRAVRERVLAEPGLFVKTRREARLEPPLPSAAALLQDLDLAGVLVRRVARRYSESRSEPAQLEQLSACMVQVAADLERLRRLVEEEGNHAAAGATGSDSGAESAGCTHPPDREDPPGLAGEREEGPRVAVEHAAEDRPRGEGGGIPAGDPGAARRLRRQPAAGP